MRPEALDGPVGSVGREGDVKEVVLVPDVAEREVELKVPLGGECNHLAKKVLLTAQTMWLDLMFILETTAVSLACLKGQQWY